MKTIIVVVPPRPVSGLSACLAEWKGRLSTSFATFDSIPDNGNKTTCISAATQTLGSFAKFRVDGIVLMGGFEGQDSRLNRQALNDQLRIYDKRRMMIAAVGSSCLFLAQAGLLVGKQATTSSVPSAIETLRRYGGIYQKIAVVRSGWLITSDGTSMAAFANAIAESLLV